MRLVAGTCVLGVLVAKGLWAWGMCGVVSSLFLSFFGGFCVDMGGEERRRVCLSVVVDVRFRVVGMVGDRVCGGTSLEVGWVCLLQRERVRVAG